MSSRTNRATKIVPPTPMLPSANQLVDNLLKERKLFVKYSLYDEIKDGTKTRYTNVKASEESGGVMLVNTDKLIQIVIDFNAMKFEDIKQELQSLIDKVQFE